MVKTIPYKYQLHRRNNRSRKKYFSKTY